ncbi:MAG: hypothetical protein ACI9WU_004394 [Myxococcota bacterium]|jgi:hypothetical protein
MPSADALRATQLIRTIVDSCPDRLAGSASELRAQEILKAEMDAAGTQTELRPFRYNTHLYATLALHFGLAVLATALVWVSAALAFALHLLVAVSYTLDSSRRARILRRLMPFVDSQNLVATLPARAALRLRLVFVAHADAAYTGIVFNPNVVHHATKQPPIAALGFMRKGLRVATVSVLLLAVLDLLVVLGVGVPAWIFWPLTIPAFLAFALNFEVVLRNTLVPGANDNLTGCAANVILAERLADRPDDVELVFVASGAEEAGCGGAWGLALDKAADWSTDNTVILGIDGLSNGKIRWFEDGEVLPMPPAQKLIAAVESAAAADPRFAEVERYEIPTGATDCSPFLAMGYHAVCIGCVDPWIGAPKHYHLPTDTPDNLDVEQYDLSIDFVEAAARSIIAAY